MVTERRSNLLIPFWFFSKLAQISARFCFLNSRIEGLLSRFDLQLGDPKDELRRCLGFQLRLQEFNPKLSFTFLLFARLFGIEKGRTIWGNQLGVAFLGIHLHEMDKNFEPACHGIHKEDH
ncbi:hypothetical protein M9H77_22691 [Catharanthus roseus]|uniref:Uncharacterized protein n=1 Tax=Catharanthus roseus TaxID=4058 RepID=A0ACC0AV98_CATRO|nr:hypothetical protein M9H77_22691 [Catharanthus roseus]